MLAGLPEPRSEQSMRSNFARAVVAMSHMIQRGRRNQSGFTIRDRRQVLAVGRAGFQLIAPSQPGNQKSARAIDAGHYSPDRNVEDQRGLGVAELLNRRQVEGSREGRRKRAIDIGNPPQLSPLNNSGLDGIRVLLVGDRFDHELLDRDEGWMRPSRPEHVEVNVAQDSKEPGFEVRPRLESPLRRDGAGDRLLGQVLSRFAVASQRPGKAKQPRPQVHDLSRKIAFLLGATVTHGSGGAPSLSREYPRPGVLKSRLVARKRGHRLYNTGRGANFPA